MKTNVIYYVKIKFRFSFYETGIMESIHCGASTVNYDAAISKAWNNMASDEFQRKLILNTKIIEVINIEKYIE
jgi:hypothetical protein